MTTETIIFLIIGGLLVFVCSGFVIHTIEHNRKERRRLELMLRKKSSNLHYMLEHFPVTFLGSDLQILICKSLLDVYEQLTRLTPRDKRVSDQITQITQKLQNLSKQNTAQQHQSLQNAAQIAEIKGMLNMLNNFVGRLQSEKAITRDQATNYTQQLQMLLNQTAVDSYAIGARDAESKGKYRLAIHYYQSALDKLSKQNMDSTYHEHMINYQHRIDELQPVADSQPTGMEEAPAPATEEESKEKEWDKFLVDDPWKKKTMYD